MALCSDMSYWSHLYTIYILPFNAVGVFTTALSTEGTLFVRSDGMVPMRVVHCGVFHRHGRHLRHKGRCIVASLPVSGVKEDALHAHRLACFSMVCSLSSIFSPYPSVQSGFLGGWPFDKATHTCINHFSIVGFDACRFRFGRPVLLEFPKRAVR